MRNVFLLTIAAIIVVANSWGVVSAWHNRSSVEGGSLELTERELRLVRGGTDSTVLLFRLAWEVEQDSEGFPVWFDAAKLKELGFNCQIPPSDPHARSHYSAMLAKSVYAVLEYEGDTWKKLESRTFLRTHLLVVDAGLNAPSLKVKYPDASRYAIVQAIARPVFVNWNKDRQAPLSEPRLAGRIERVVPDLLQVPPPHNQFLLNQGATSRDERKHQEITPRYSAIVCWGKDYEPWLKVVQLLKE